jgi:hypothetical protein
MGENSNQNAKSEMCLICAEFTGSFKHPLTTVTQFSRREIHQMFGKDEKYKKNKI